LDSKWIRENKMDTSGFYKVVDQLEYAPNFVDTPTVSLNREDKDTYTYPQDGWYWFESSGEAVIALADVSNTRYITKLAFYNRLLPEEAIAIDLGSIGATVPAATLRYFFNKITMANYVDLDLPELLTGLQTLEQYGILAAGRADIIINATISPVERP
jgi:hypothetical protein